MSSPCTVPRLFRCRVRDLASCFYACRLPLEEEAETFSNKPPQIMSKRSIVFDSRGGGDNSETGEMSTARKMSKENGKESVQRSLSSGRTAEDGSSRPVEPHFAEEEYIVFCFREDGEIHMINEGCRSDHRKGGGTGSMEKESKWPPDNEVKEMNKKMADSFESYDSNLSDTSTSSFAFPVLGIEWIGSPVQMPKSEKQEEASPSLLLQCCRF